jgi:hypothetical protein
MVSRLIEDPTRDFHAVESIYPHVKTPLGSSTDFHYMGMGCSVFAQVYNDHFLAQRDTPQDFPPLLEVRFEVGVRGEVYQELEKAARKRVRDLLSGYLQRKSGIDNQRDRNSILDSTAGQIRINNQAERDLSKRIEGIILRSFVDRVFRTAYEISGAQFSTDSDPFARIRIDKEGLYHELIIAPVNQREDEGDERRDLRTRLEYPLCLILPLGTKRIKDEVFTLMRLYFPNDFTPFTWNVQDEDDFIITLEEDTIPVQEFVRGFFIRERETTLTGFGEILENRLTLV